MHLCFHTSVGEVGASATAGRRGVKIEWVLAKGLAAGRARGHGASLKICRRILPEDALPEVCEGLLVPLGREMGKDAGVERHMRDGGGGDWVGLSGTEEELGDPEE